jgi:Tfp pilus assembly protein PilF
MYAILGKEESFDQLLNEMNKNVESSDISKKIRIYKLRVLQSYFSLAKGQDSKADQQIKSAIDYMYGNTSEETKKKSIFYLEKTIYHLQTYEWDQAKKEITEALSLDPNNALADQIFLEMGNS